MSTPKRSTELLSLAAVLFPYCVGTFGSAWSVFHGWTGLDFAFVYLIGFIVVFATSLTILLRDTCIFGKVVLFPMLGIFAMCSFLMIGRDDVGYSWYHLGHEYFMQEPSRTVTTLSTISYFLFFICGFISLILMIVSASSRKRTLVDR